MSPSLRQWPLLKTYRIKFPKVVFRDKTRPAVLRGFKLDPTTIRTRYFDKSTSYSSGTCSTSSHLVLSLYSTSDSDWIAVSSFLTFKREKKKESLSSFTFHLHLPQIWLRFQIFLSFSRIAPLSPGRWRSRPGRGSDFGPGFSCRDLRSNMAAANAPIIMKEVLTVSSPFSFCKSHLESS